MYAARPPRIQGGFDAAIFGFALDRVPPSLTGPLILRLGRANTDPGRMKLETVIQNTLAEMGFPAPRVMMTEVDPSVLGGPFMVMTRLSGKPGSRYRGVRRRYHFRRAAVVTLQSSGRLPQDY